MVVAINNVFLIRLANTATERGQEGEFPGGQGSKWAPKMSGTMPLRHVSGFKKF